MQQESSNTYFQVFQKKRLKVQEMHRTRREDLFNKSRNLLEFGVHCLNLQDDKSGEVGDEGESCSYEGSGGVFQGDVKGKDSGVGQGGMGEEGTKQISNKIKNKGKFSRKYAKILQIPSWMNTVPQLFNNFYGMARPSGKTCLLVILNNNFYLYDKSGRKTLLSNLCNLPHNASKLCHILDGTILQCILTDTQPSKFLYIVDCVQWKQTLMSAQNFQFRLGWLMANAGNLVSFQMSGLNIRLVEYLLMDNIANLEKIYQGQYGYERQGLKFVHRQSPYIHGYNQNVLLWKDFKTSKYAIDDPTTNEMQSQLDKPEYIYGTGLLTKSGLILSLDRYKLGYMNVALLATYQGGYIRYRTTGIQFTPSSLNSPTTTTTTTTTNTQIEDQIKLKDFEIIEYRKYSRVDPLSKIIFQYRIRNDPLTIQQIVNRMK